MVKLQEKPISLKQNYYSPSEIIDIFKAKEIDKEWSFIEYKPSDTSKLTHCYHRYPAKFIPQLVERLMGEYLSDVYEPHVNDLFMGSGTTLACAIARGYRASGTDINYVAELITKVKCTPLEPKYLKIKINNILSDLSFLELPLFPSKIKPYIPSVNLERIDYWFKPEAKQELAIILARIIEEKDTKVKDFFTVCFSHILKIVSIWLMGSTKPTRDMYKKIQKPFIAFKRHLMKMERGNEAFWKVVPEKIKNNLKEYLCIKRADARHQPAEDNTVDIQITSSPYVTSYEYADLHQLSTIWLEFTDDLKNYRKEFIGTAYKSYNSRSLKSEIGKEIVNKLEKKDAGMF